MTPRTLWTIIALLASGFAFMTLVNYGLRSLNDDLTAIAISDCMRPANVEPFEQVFYFEAGER